MLTTLKTITMATRKFSKKKDGAIFRPDKVIAREKAVKNAKKAPTNCQWCKVPDYTPATYIDLKGRTPKDAIEHFLTEVKKVTLTK